MPVVDPAPEEKHRVIPAPMADFAPASAGTFRATLTPMPEVAQALAGKTLVTPASTVEATSTLEEKLLAVPARKADAYLAPAVRALATIIILAAFVISWSALALHAERALPPVRRGSLAFK